MPVPMPGLSWATRQVVTDAAGSLEERLAITVTDAQTWKLGDCSYVVLPVEVTIGEGVEAYVERILYLPDLGIGVLVAFVDSQGTLDYDYVDIAVEPS
jgi:hypothetical protein